MRIYLSGPITGDEGAAEHFMRAHRNLEAQGHHVMNPFLIGNMLPEGVTYEECMALDVHLLDMCDAICLLDGWERSCGANREFGYSLATEKIILHEDVMMAGLEAEDDEMQI
jgi:nucleoside 2-deoxyribosyltransferase